MINIQSSRHKFDIELGVKTLDIVVVVVVVVVHYNPTNQIKVGKYHTKPMACFFVIQEQITHM